MNTETQTTVTTPTTPAPVKAPAKRKAAKAKVAKPAAKKTIKRQIAEFASRRFVPRAEICKKFGIVDNTARHYIGVLANTPGYDVRYRKGANNKGEYRFVKLAAK